jgi:hypothetical protein
MPLARHVVILLLYTLANGMELLNMLRTQTDPQYMFISHIYASQRTLASIIWPQLDLQHTFKPQTFRSINVSNLFTVYDQYSHRSAVLVHVSQTYTQYTISTHLDLQYMWFKPIHSIWSVLTSICSICDSNLYAVHDQFSHRSTVYVTQTYTQYMISTHIDLQYMWLKPKRSTWLVLTSICSICDSNQ